MEHTTGNCGSKSTENLSLSDCEWLIFVCDVTEFEKLVLEAQVFSILDHKFETHDEFVCVVLSLVTSVGLQFVENAFFEEWIYESLVWLTLHHRDEHSGGPFANIIDF